MTGPGLPGVLAPGLLGRLAAAVRPEFRASVLVFDPADPVFGRGVCLVDGCGWQVHGSRDVPGSPAAVARGGTA